MNSFDIDRQLQLSWAEASVNEVTLDRTWGEKSRGEPFFRLIRWIGENDRMGILRPRGGECSQSIDVNPDKIVV
jgi:hypothetical protein